MIIGLVVYFVFFFNKEKAPVETENVRELVPAQNDQSTGTTVTPITQKEEEQITQTVNMEALASSFAERYGSFSSQSNFENIIELKLVMTDSMQKWADKYVTEQKEKMPESTEYYGITTKALTTKALSDNGTSAKYLVNTQRVETFNDGKTNMFFQEIEISLLKVNGDWKVDNAVWK